MVSSVHVVLNEVDANATFHCDALADLVPSARRIDYPAGERFDPDKAEAVVLTGSTAGVYERDVHPWIDEEEELIRSLVDRSVPILGVCFGHQLLNVALGGRVEPGAMTAGLVAADLADNPLFEDVEPAVPALHGDRVCEIGDGLERIASAPHAEIFGTAHPDRPIWTVQFHPEITADMTDALAAYDWQMNSFSWEEVTAGRVIWNFVRQIE